ncbi:metallophosphoesterase [Brevibacillus migulae]|uniref:metallophosphoesterase n=1 Tax=Brevibacillus migulae TaxID=1644114 RepID=UPI00106E310B|nr:metallophosphoesterase [Brevibacillus migulae]
MKTYKNMLRTGTAAFAALSLMIGVMSSQQAAWAASENKATFAFGLVADAQYCECDTNGTRNYRASLDKMKEAAATFNKHDLAFTIQLGDIIDRDKSSFSKIVPLYNQIKGPRYHVLGNHDFPVPVDEVVRILEMPRPYYDFSKDGWRFVVIDTNDLSSYEDPTNADKKETAESYLEVLKWSGAMNAQTWNGGVSSEQMTWLQNVLAQAKQANEKVVVFGHMALYPKNEHNVWNDEALLKTLESAGNVVAYFNGHNHAGNYGFKNGVHYLNFQGMVETPDSNSYSIVKVYPDRLEIDGYGREKDRTLKIGKEK